MDVLRSFTAVSNGLELQAKRCVIGDPLKDVHIKLCEGDFCLLVDLASDERMQRCQHTDLHAVIRLYEYTGEEQTAVFGYFSREYTFTLSPFEIKTLKFDGKDWIDIMITEK